MLLIKLITFLLTFSSIRVLSDECGRKSTTKFVIYNGATSNPNQWPWLARLFHQDSEKFFCSSTLISEKHLLSAAHCVKYMDTLTVRNPESIFAMLGGSNITDLCEAGWTRKNISKIIPHPEFGLNTETSRFDADIAILVMHQKVQFSDRIKKICFPIQSQEIDNFNGVVVGHGVNEENQLQDIAKYINITVIKWSDCVFMDSEFSKILSKRSFCAGGKGGRIACHGDSGGGFYVLHDSIWRIYGIVSAARVSELNDDICNDELPTVFTNVGKFNEWIEKIVNSTSSDPIEINRFITKKLVIKLKHLRSFYKDFHLDIPEDDSTFCTAILSSDLIQPENDNLKNLIQLSEGDGEQISTQFLKSIIARRFLDETFQLTNTEKNKFNEILDENYQKLLTIQNEDGSFDLWGTNEAVDIYKWILNQGSDYLDFSAFVVKLLTQFDLIKNLPDKVAIFKVMKFIEKQQKSDGSFKNNGKTQFKELDKFSNIESVSLTAFILIEIFENNYLKDNFGNLLENGLNFIESKFYEILNDGTNYERALTLYLYILAGKNHELIMVKLMDNSCQSDGKLFWNLNQEISSSSAIQVEISSYVALSLIKLEKYEEIIKVYKFLITKKNFQGIFDSLTASLLGLQALAEISREFNTKDENLELTLTNELHERFLLSLDETRKKSQIYFQPTSKLSIEANGNGVATFEIVCQFKQKIENPKKHFELSVNVRKSDEIYINLNVCVKTIIGKSSRKIVMEIKLPSGYLHFSGPSGVEDLKIIDGGSTILINLESKTNVICIKNIKAVDVAIKNLSIKPSVTVSDYYEPDKMEIYFYKIN